MNDERTKLINDASAGGVAAPGLSIVKLPGDDCHILVRWL